MQMLINGGRGTIFVGGRIEIPLKMPFSRKPECTECKSTNSDLWRKTSEEEVLCNECYLKETQPEKRSNGEGSSKSGVGSTFIGTVRKSARIKPSKYRNQVPPKPLATKGKSRRVVFKKNPIKAPPSVATVVTSDYLFYKGTYFQVGDIVSVIDEDDGEVYYAQLRGFLQDQYMEKSAVITWLLPTKASPPDTFDPSTFILGPEEDMPRKLECFEFVCHAPSDYFKSQGAPYPTPHKQAELGFVWTSLGTEIRRLPPSDEIYGLREPSVESSIEDVEKTAEIKTEKSVKLEKQEKKTERGRESVKERRESARREKREKKHS